LDDKEKCYIIVYFGNCSNFSSFMLNFDFLPFFSISVVDDFKVAEELTRADAVVFTYACDEPTTLERLSTF
jgi:hypothetical protein